MLWHGIQLDVTLLRVPPVTALPDDSSLPQQDTLPKHTTKSVWEYLEEHYKKSNTLDNNFATQYRSLSKHTFKYNLSIIINFYII